MAKCLLILGIAILMAVIARVAMPKHRHVVVPCLYLFGPLSTVTIGGVLKEPEGVLFALVVGLSVAIWVGRRTEAWVSVGALTEASARRSVVRPLLALSLFSLVGGLLVGGLVDGAERAWVVGIFASLIAAVLAGIVHETLRMARVRATPPIVVRIATILDSKWADKKPSFQVRLVRADGTLLGDFWLEPAPQFVELLKPATRLIVQWHPDNAGFVIVDWRGSVDLPDHGGYRS